MQTLAQKPTARPLWIRWAFAAALFISLWFGWRVWVERNTERLENLAPVKFTNLVGLQVPEAAKDFRAYAEHFQHWTVFARFSISRTELPVFLEENDLEESDVPVGPLWVIYGSRFDWWNPPGGDFEDGAIQPFRGQEPRFHKYVIFQNRQLERIEVFILASDQKR